MIVPLCTSNPICSTGFHLYCNKIASREQLKVQRLHIDSAREYKQSSLLLHTNKSTSESAQHNQLTWTEAGFTFSTSLGRSVYIATLTFQSTTFVLLVMRKGNSFKFSSRLSLMLLQPQHFNRHQVQYSSVPEEVGH